MTVLIDYFLVYSLDEEAHSLAIEVYFENRENNGFTSSSLIASFGYIGSSFLTMKSRKKKDLAVDSFKV